MLDKKRKEDSLEAFGLSMSFACRMAFQLV